MKYKPQGLYFFTNRKMIGLSLEGGGARGAYQAGAAKAFKEKNIIFQGVVGTSIGSINGAMIAQGETDSLVEIWENISLEKVFNMSRYEYDELRKFDLDIDKMAAKFKKAADIIKDGGIDISLAQKILDEYIDEKKIRERKIDFGIVTFSLTEMKPIEIFIDEIPKGELKNYLLASSALPHFKLDKIHGIKYLDGGFYSALPTDLLINKGYKEIWEVRLNSFGRKKTLDIDESIITLHYIEPNEPLSGYLDFSNEMAKKQLSLGYYDTIKKIEGLHGKFYYLKPKNDENYFLNLLGKVPMEVIGEFITALNLEHSPSRRTVFEVIVPRIAELLDIQRGASYEEIIVSFLEVQAMELDIERFKIYSFEDFFNEILRKSREHKEKEDKANKVIEFFLKNELLAKVSKEKSIRHLCRIVIRGLGDLHEKKDRLGENII